MRLWARLELEFLYDAGQKIVLNVHVIGKNVCFELIESSDAKDTGGGLDDIIRITNECTHIIIIWFRQVRVEVSIVQLLSRLATHTVTEKIVKSDYFMSCCEKLRND